MFRGQVISSCTAHCTTSANLTCGCRAAPGYTLPLCVFDLENEMCFSRRSWGCRSPTSACVISYLKSKVVLYLYHGTCQVGTGRAWTLSFCRRLRVQARYDRIFARARPATSRLVVKVECEAEACFPSDLLWWIALIRAAALTACRATLGQATRSWA